MSTQKKFQLDFSTCLWDSVVKKYYNLIGLEFLDCNSKIRLFSYMWFLQKVRAVPSYSSKKVYMNISKNFQNSKNFILGPFLGLITRCDLFLQKSSFITSRHLRLSNLKSEQTYEPILRYGVVDGRISRKATEPNL